MSQGITHFAVGAACTTLVVTFLIPGIRYPRVWVAAGGSWAMVPDVGKLVPHPVVLSVHHSRWADLFWFHYTLDRLDPLDSTLWGALAIAGFIAATAIAEYRGYRALAVIRKLAAVDTDEPVEPS